MDLKQDKTEIELDISIQRPYVIIKDRPYNQEGLEIDLGEIRIGNRYREDKGRFKLAPEKTVHMTALIFDCKGLSIKYSLDRFEVVENFDLKLDFEYLTISPLLGNIDSKELDKSYNVTMEMNPSFNMRLRSDIYTYLCRCIDLNFNYTDYLDDKFNFRNVEEYFKSTDFLLKSRTRV